MSNVVFNVSSYIRELIQKYPNLSNSEIRQLAITHNKTIQEKYSNTLENLTKLISKVRKNPFSSVEIDTSDTPKELQTPYKVIGDTHYFEPQKGKFSLPNYIVDELFYSFSKYGLDLSQTQIINKYNLEPWQWHAIKSALKLYKLSNIFSPHTVNITDPEEMKEMVRKKMDENINTLGYTVENEYNKSIVKKYKDVIRQQTKRDLESQTIITELQDLLPQVKINTKPISESKSFSNEDKDIIVVISDIHFGLSNDGDENLPDYSIEKTKEILFNISKQVNQLNASRVHVFNLGDIIETFQGNNHIGSWKGIEKGYYGSRLVIECYKLFVEFLLSIENLASYNQLPGNHDRSSSDNKEDVEGFISRIVFEFLQNSFKFDIKQGNIEFNYNDILLSKKIGNINYLATHGHLGISKTPPSELILEYAEDPKSYTILLQGHLHDRKVKRDHKLFRDIICPAIMPGNHYSVTSGFSGNPGFLVIRESEEKKPIIIDYSL